MALKKYPECGSDDSLPAAKRLPRYLTAAQVAAEYGLSTEIWRGLARRGEVAATEIKSERGIRNRMAFERASVEAYLRDNTVQPPPKIDDRQAAREWRNRYAAENYRNGGKG